jgi:hypothetical protein
MASQSSEQVLTVSDKTHTAKPAHKLQYEPSAGDYRDAQARAAADLAESNTFSFHDLKLPSNKELLAALQSVSKKMGEQTGGAGQLSDGSLLAVGKDGKNIKEAAIVRPDGSSDVAKFDKKLNVTSETTSTTLGTRERDYRPDGTLASEQNEAGSYKDKIEFDRKGHIVHTHSESPADTKDDKRLADGSGLYTDIHHDSDPTKAFVLTETTKANGAQVQDQRFANGDFVHIEADAHGQITLQEKSDVAKGMVDRLVRQKDGTMKAFRDSLT